MTGMPLASSWLFTQPAPRIMAMLWYGGREKCSARLTNTVSAPPGPVVSMACRTRGIAQGLLASPTQARSRWSCSTMSLKSNKLSGKLKRRRWKRASASLPRAQ